MNLKANIGGQLVDLGAVTKIFDRHSLPLIAKSELENIRSAGEGAAHRVSSPENLYAEIKINGEVMATVWNATLQVAPKYYEFALEASNIETLQERVDFLAQAIGGEVSYYNKQNTSPSYSFSDSLAKILASSYK